MASKGLAALTPNANFYNGPAQARISSRLSAVIDGLSKAFGGETIGINSGYRSPARNAAVNGAKGSLHMKGLAADIDMTGWSTAKRQQAIETLSALGVGGFITYDNHPNMLHIDLRPTPLGVPHFMHNKFGVNMPKAPAWFQDVAAKVRQNPIQNQMTDVMDVPSSMTRDQALSQQLSPAAQKLANALSAMGASKEVAAQMARQAGIEAAYNSPTRTQDVVSPSSPMRPDNMAYTGPQGNFSVRSKPSAADLLGLTAGLDRPNPANRPGLNMPAGPSRPSVPANYARPAPAIGSLPAARPSLPSFNAVRPSAPTVGSLPATRPTTTVASRPATPAPTGLPAARYTPTVATRPETPAPTGLPAAPGPTTADLAAQYGQYRTPTNYEQVRQKMQAVPAPAIAPVAPPAQVVAPAPVLAPALAPPRVVKDYPVAEVAAAPAPPRATAYDVYSGLADEALDNTGMSTVARDAYGNTTVSNQYGATTAMTPGGYQSAYGNLPSLPGISGPMASKIGGALPGIAGSMIGGYLGGPAGAIAGGLLGKAISPGGILSGTKNIDTSNIGSITVGGQTFHFGPATAFARPDYSLNSFPSAPAGNRQSGFSSQSARDHARGMSPKAAADIDAGRGGLF